MKKANWTYLVLLLFIIAFTASIIIFVTNNYNQKIAWHWYVCFKVLQLGCIIVMFPGFDSWQEYKQELRNKKAKK